MKRRPPRSTRTNTLLPDTTLFRSTAQPQSATDNRIIQLMRLSPSATLTLALLLSAPAYAQDTTARDGEDDFHTDQAIVVTAPYVRSLDILGNISVLEGEKLAQDIRGQIGDSLPNPPGASDRNSTRP